MSSPRKDDDHDDTNDDLEALYRRFKALTDTKQLETDLKDVQEESQRYLHEGPSSGRHGKQDETHEHEHEQEEEEEEEEEEAEGSDSENLYDVDDEEVEQYLAAFSSTPNPPGSSASNPSAPILKPRIPTTSQTQPANSRNPSTAQDTPDKDQENGEREVDREAEEIVRRFKEEVDLDREYGRGDEEEQGEVGSSEPGVDGKSSLEKSDQVPSESGDGTGDLPGTPNPKSKSRESDPLALLASLSTPKDLKAPPVSSSNPDSPTEELDPTYARLLSLKPARSGVEFPSVPKKPVDGSAATGKTNAGATSTKKAGWEIPGWTNDRDDDLGSWCCICNADATLICVTCDSDPYCRTCWMEGHGDGPEKEKGHRVKEFVRKKDLVELGGEGV